jgi:hypothetical protein
MLVAITVPTDEVIFGVFAAGSAKLVVETSQRAGIPARRVTAAVGSYTLPTQLWNSDDAPSAR